MPRTLGEGVIHLSNFDYLVEHDAALANVKTRDPNPAYTEIGRHIAKLVPDGATLQMGIGGIPDATLSFLGDRKVR